MATNMEGIYSQPADNNTYAGQPGNQMVGDHFTGYGGGLSAPVESDLLTDYNVEVRGIQPDAELDKANYDEPASTSDTKYI